jgi:hypothetical protein
MTRSTTVAVALLLLMAGCSSSDPTTSDEYAALEQELAQTNEELAQTEVQLADITVERGVLAAEATAAVVALEETDTVVAPEGLAALVDDWYAANDRGDGSVLDLYVPEGYHLYGTLRVDYDAIPAHLSGGEHTWITEPLLITADRDGRYVVVRGMRNGSSASSNASALSFEIVTTADDELRIVHTAWIYDNGWSDG